MVSFMIKKIVGGSHDSTCPAKKCTPNLLSCPPRGMSDTT